jgi:hypothetical protein
VSGDHKSAGGTVKSYQWGGFRNVWWQTPQYKLLSAVVDSEYLDDRLKSLA